MSESNHAWHESEYRSGEPLRPVLVDMVRQFIEAKHLAVMSA